ncbi:MAG: Branched-chain amino acid ABC transporter permease protein [Erysipelotrichaceae bacterium]|nr:MAG: Branched-chain amino acid ABC transporter permease [Erysipelotrichaceae bacterium]TXT19172.1 MAG: Branched-chain amino acid ABC transporter permease protein [Erysipelotrichaceae bacterium]
MIKKLSSYKKGQPLIKNAYMSYALFGLFLALMPLFGYLGIIKSSYVTIIASVIYYSIAALGLNVLLGWTGLISLGTAGFMGLAAYISAYITYNMHLPFEIALVTAVVVSTLLGVLVGYISLRIEGIYLAIATLAVAEILRKTFEVFDPFTGGASGKPISYPTLFFFYKYSRADLKIFETLLYLILVLFLIAVMILVHNLMKGQVGRALNALRGSEAAAQAMGINLLKYRLFAFGFASATASLAGVLYVHYNRYTNPDRWLLALSLNLVAAIIIGGVRNIYGTILGVFIVVATKDMVLAQIPYFANNPNFALMFNGILIILIILYYPYGLIRIGADLKKLVVKIKEKF